MILMSQLTHDNIDVMSTKTTEEFKVLENVILTAFKILDEYEKLVESSKVSGSHSIV